MAKKGPIIVVDDDPDDQYLYEVTLSKFRLDNKVIVLNNGAEALRYFSSSDEEPFLILCDINMPVMNGLQLRQAMCEPTTALSCKKSTPFIFMSTSARTVDIEKAAGLYTHGFFQKETSLDRHEKTLRMIIEYWSNCRDRAA